MHTRKIVIGIFFSVLSVLWVIPAAAENCYTGCKEGPKEFSSGVTWICSYDRTGNRLGFSDTDVDNKRDSVCQLTIRGRFKNIAIDFGNYENIQQCMEELCIPKVLETCGELDRCNNVKNWRKY
jgi:hypothetical protein